MKRLDLTLAILKPSVVSRPYAVKDVVNKILINDLFIIKSDVTNVSRERALSFYKEHEGKFFYNRLVTYMSSGPIVTMILAGVNAIPQWRHILGPTKVYKTQYEVPSSIRGLHGISDTRNAGHGSDSVEAARSELAFFYPGFDIDKWYMNEEPFFRAKKNIYFDEKLGIHRLRDSEMKFHSS